MHFVKKAGAFILSMYSCIHKFAYNEYLLFCQGFDVKQQLRKICFYTVDKHVRDLLVSVEKAFFFFFGLADVLSSED